MVHSGLLAHILVLVHLAYVHVPDPKRTKLDDKSKKYVLIGYDEKSKAYKLYDPIENKLVVSRDVEVNEEAGWDWKNQQEEKCEEGIKVPTRVDEASSSRSSDEESDSGSSEENDRRNPRFRSVQDLYESTGEVHLVCLLADAEMISFEEAARDEKWKAAMDEEIIAIEKNKTWDLVDLPKGHKAIGVKWVYR